MARGTLRLDFFRDRRRLFVRQKVGLVQHDEIGAEKLILVDFLERVVVIDRGIDGALRCDFLRIIGEAAGAYRRAIDHRDDAIDGDAVADIGPFESFDERLRQRQSGRLDDDVLRRWRARQKRFERRYEIFGDRAADAAVRQLDDVLLRAALDAAGAQDRAVDADVAEFVDDQRQAAAFGVFDRVTHERRLSGTEKAGNDRDGDFARGHSGGSNSNAQMRTA